MLRRWMHPIPMQVTVRMRLRMLAAEHARKLLGRTVIHQGDLESSPLLPTHVLGLRCCSVTHDLALCHFQASHCHLHVLSPYRVP